MELFGVWSNLIKDDTSDEWKATFARTPGPDARSQSCSGSRILGNIDEIYPDEDIKWGEVTGFNSLKAGVEHKFKSGYKIWNSDTAEEIVLQQDAKSPFIVIWDDIELETIEGSLFLGVRLISTALLSYALI